MKKCTTLFICVLLVFAAQAQNNHLSSKELKETIKKYFIIDEVPVRYYSNILVQIQGNSSPKDSIIVSELIDTLNTLISTWDVHYIPEGTSNLILEINKPNGELYSSSRLGNRKRQEIIESNVVINMPDSCDDLTRRKILYFHFFRALVQFNYSKEFSALYPGCVFTEQNYADITFNPVDFELLQGIYSKKFDNDIRNKSSRVNLIPTNKRKLIKLLSTLIAYLLPLLVLLVCFQKGVFSKHNYILIAYLKQGAIVVGLGVLSVVILSSNTILFLGFEVPMNILTIVGIIFFSALIFGVLGFIVILLMYYCEKIILKGNNSLLFQTIFPFFTTTLLPSFFLIILTIVVPKPKGAETMPIDVAYLSLSFMSFFISVAVLRSFLIYISRKAESLIHEKDVELARLGEMHKQAELQSLRSKINPHFLYNSLNSIASLAKINPEKTEEMALALSDFFRYSINREQKHMNTIAEELEAVKTYLDIEKVRFGNRLDFIISCSEDLYDVKIPQLLIQPFVENAIKHGISERIDKGEIRIEIEKEKNKLRIRIVDNGPDFPTGPLSGFGIRNANERISLLYGNRASINWQNENEKYIEISLPL